MSRNSTSTTVLIAAAATATVLCATGFTLSNKGISKTKNDPKEDFWKERWDTGKTGWHRSDVNPTLTKYEDEVLLENFPAGGARILVPLCGKTVDMAHLATKRKVAQIVGVDLVPEALQQFSQENPDLEIKQDEECMGAFDTWQGHGIRLLAGDFFKLDSEVAGGKFDAVWDRAALVALQPSMREAYVNQLGQVLDKPDGRILLSTYVRPDGNTKIGPPFSIDEAEVRRLFEGKPWVASVEQLESRSALSLEPWWKAIIMYIAFRGDVQEHVFLIKTK